MATTINGTVSFEKMALSFWIAYFGLVGGMVWSVLWMYSVRFKASRWFGICLVVYCGIVYLFILLVAIFA